MSASPAPTRRRQARGTRRRIAILQAATDLFAQRGYRGTSLADIASVVGISQAGLLHHFPTKGQLLEAVLTERDRHGNERLDGLLADERLSYLGAMSELVRDNESQRAAVQMFTLLVAEGIPQDGPSHDYWVTRYALVRRMALHVLRTEQAAGHIRADIDIGAVAPLVAAVMDGLQIQWLLSSGSVAMGTSFEVFAAALGSWLSTSFETDDWPSVRPSAETTKATGHPVTEEDG